MSVVAEGAELRVVVESGVAVEIARTAMPCATSLAVTQDDATSVPGSGCNSNERSTGEPNTTVPLPLPRDSAEAPAASAHNPGPKMVLRIFTINSVFRSEGFLHISPR